MRWIILTLFWSVMGAQEVCFVSLGSHCEPAVMIKERGLRRAAYPFDWMETTSHEGLLAVLREDFAFFLERRYLVLHPRAGKIVENTYYECEFRHDQMSKPFAFDLTEWVGVEEKYGRRIQRFRELDRFPGRVCFIRAAFDFNNDPCPYWNKPGIERIEKWQARELQEALSAYFPHLDFILIIVNYAEENTLPIEGVERVREYRVRKGHKGIDYLRIFLENSKTVS